MKKIVLGSMLLVSTSLMAEDMFIGLEMGNSSFDAKMNANVVGFDGISETTSDDAKHTSFKIGTIQGDKRSSLTYTSYNTEGDSDLTSFGASYDYIFSMNDKLKPYVGITAQYVMYEEDTSDLGIDFDKFEMSGIVGSVQFGALYEITNQFSIEGGYRQSLLSTVSGDELIDFQGLDIKLELEIDSISGAYFGLNYKF